MSKSKKSERDIHKCVVTKGSTYSPQYSNYHSTEDPNFATQEDYSFEHIFCHRRGDCYCPDQSGDQQLS